jgi:23S rRNA pseudouridine2605 synthase
MNAPSALNYLNMEERLQKILSQWGVASRRQAETLILNGRVRLNGQVVQLGQKANPYRDHIEVDGVVLQPAQRPPSLYLLLHKPMGVVSTCYDPWGRPTVLDLLPQELRHTQGLHPIGRLDADTTGALLLTNDGTLTFGLTHPRHGIPKTYEVWVQGYPPKPILQAWREGIMLSGRKTLPAQVRVIKHESGSQTLLEVILKEGRNRQIRRVAEQLGYPVVHLHRSAIGPIYLQRPKEPMLTVGTYRPLDDFELKFLQTQLDLSPINVPGDSEEYAL